jgi:hypothetical protein
MCKSSNRNFTSIPSFDAIKQSAHDYRRKLALKIKETLENDPITEEEISILESILETKVTNP